MKQKERAMNSKKAPTANHSEGATITVGISILILTVAIHHSLMGEALNEILCLVNLHCISPNLCPKSLFQLKRHFHNVPNPVVYHYFRAGCLEKITDKTKTNICPNMMCQQDLRSIYVTAWKFP